MPRIGSSARAIRPSSSPPTASAAATASIDVAEQLARAVEQSLAGERELDAVGGAPQQLAADQLLETSNLPAEGRLRDVEPLGRAAEVELLGHGHERPQVAQLDAVRGLGEGEDAASADPCGKYGPLAEERSCRSCNAVLRDRPFPLRASGASLAGVLVAGMTLRFGSVRVAATVHWPRVETVSLALVLSDELSPIDSWLERSVVVGLAGGIPSSIELAALHWVSQHVDELGAEGDCLLVAGGARAARLALAARDSGWPVLRRQLLVHPRFTAEQPMPTNVARRSARNRSVPRKARWWPPVRRAAARRRGRGSRGAR